MKTDGRQDSPLLVVDFYACLFYGYALCYVLARDVFCVGDCFCLCAFKV